MPVKLTQIQAEEKVKDYNNQYELISTYTKSKEPVILRHNCGEEYTIGRFKSFFEGTNRCPKCYPPQSNVGHSTKRVTESDVIHRIKNERNDYEYVSGYVNMNTKCNIKHLDCGNIFLISPKMLLGVKKRGCPDCGNKKRGKYLVKESYLEDIVKSRKDGDEYQWLEEYSGDNKKKLKILHIKCNRTYKVRPNDFQQGYNCPHCAQEQKESKYASYMKKFLKEKNIEFSEEKQFKNLFYKRNLSIDVYISSLNLCIEYDGIQHFKSTYGEKTFKETRHRDLIKNQWCVDNNKNLLRLHYKLNEEEISQILEELVTTNKLSLKTCKKFNLYYYNSKNDILINSNNYYKNKNHEEAK